MLDGGITSTHKAEVQRSKSKIHGNGKYGRKQNTKLYNNLFNMFFLYLFATILTRSLSLLRQLFFRVPKGLSQFQTTTLKL